MSLLPEETSEWHEFEYKRMQGRTRELKKIQAEAEQISQLMADPRWEFYGRFLETPLVGYEKAIEGLEKKVKTQFLDPTAYGQLMVKKAHYVGYAEGLKFALAIAKVLITEGEKAAAELAALEGSKSE